MKMGKVMLVGAAGVLTLAGIAAGGPGKACSSKDATLTMNVMESKPDIVDTAIAAGSFNTLVTAVKAADLVQALKGPGPFTVFAPTDAAFAKVPAAALNGLLQNKPALQGVLTYHVVSGELLAGDVIARTTLSTLNGQRLDIEVRDGKVFVDGAQVVKTDILCGNGVIHVLDSVVMPASDNIVATAQSAGQFATLLAAAKAAGLVDALSAGGPITVFAPTDEAFSKLPAGTVESLLKPENREKLAAILKYHVVSGRVYSNDALGAQTAATLNGQSVRVTLKDGQLRVNDARVIMNDIEASNGVIHVIDRVILPAS